MNLGGFFRSLSKYFALFLILGLVASFIEGLFSSLGGIVTISAVNGFFDYLGDALGLTAENLANMDPTTLNPQVEIIGFGFFAIILCLSVIVAWSENKAK